MQVDRSVYCHTDDMFLPLTLFASLARFLATDVVDHACALQIRSAADCKSSVPLGAHAVALRQANASRIRAFRRRLPNRRCQRAADAAARRDGIGDALLSNRSPPFQIGMTGEAEAPWNERWTLGRGFVKGSLAGAQPEASLGDARRSAEEAYEVHTALARGIRDVELGQCTGIGSWRST
jgi:hypothetical protein